MSHYCEGSLTAEKRVAAATGVLYKAPAFYDHMHLVSKEVATVTNLLIETGATSVGVVGEGEK